MVSPSLILHAKVFFQSVLPLWIIAIVPYAMPCGVSRTAHGPLLMKSEDAFCVNCYSLHQVSSSLVFRIQSCEEIDILKIYSAFLKLKRTFTASTMQCVYQNYFYFSQELALLHHKTRSATVLCKDEVSLLAVCREVGLLLNTSYYTQWYFGSQCLN